MKKTNFPDKCSACRLENRDRMRRELEGINPVSKSKVTDEDSASNLIRMTEGKGKNKVKFSNKKRESEVDKETVRRSERHSKFTGVDDLNFPSLPHE
jgi:hypothetical protein